MSSVQLIIANIKLPKSLWGEILKTVAYLKNQSLSQKGLTLYKRANEEKLNLRHLHVIGLKIWMHVPEKLEKKLNNGAWQEIFIGYKEKNFYKTDHPFTRKIYKTWDVDIDKGLLYNKSEIN